MTLSFLRVMKLVIISLLFSILFTSCAYKNPINGNTNFHSLVSKLVDDSSIKIKKNLQANDVVLVSDFVNLDKLKNKSQLGFLLSSMLKDKLVSLDILVREIELGKDFELGKTGFIVLTRQKDKIITDKIVNSRYAVVGTYSITSRSLNVFIKLIDVNTGYILSSSFTRTDIDDEILGLEGESDLSSQKRNAPVRPFLVL